MILLDSTYDSVSAAPSDVIALNKKLLEQGQLLSKERYTLRRTPPYLTSPATLAQGRPRSI
jgi:hypothetical protein